MGIVGGTPRHYSGKPPAAAGYAWTCKGCGTENLTPFEGGCQACGLGKPTPAGVPVAQGVTISTQRLNDAIISDTWDDGTTITVELQALSPQARQTLALALAAYAEHGPTPSNLELPRVITLAWARLIQDALNQADETGAAPPEESK